MAKTNLDVKETSYQPLVHHAAPPGILHDTDSGRASPAPYAAGGYQAPARGGFDPRLEGGYESGYGGNRHNNNGGYGHGY